MSDSLSRWVCQTCGGPANDDGVVEVININIDLGDIGSYPVRPTQDPVDSDSESADLGRQLKRVDKQILENLGAKLDASKPNNAFVVRHVTCIADQEIEGYWFETNRAPTIEAWVGWVLHLSEKSWMGRQDILAMLRFWWTNSGAAPPSV